MLPEEVEESTVVGDVFRIAQNEMAGKQLNGDQPFVIGNERVVGAITDARIEWQYTEAYIRQPGQGYESVDLQRHYGRLAELPAHRGFSQQELETLRGVVQSGLALEFEGNGHARIGRCRFNRRMYRGAHVLGYLKQASDERRQEVAYLDWI